MNKNNIDCIVIRQAENGEPLREWEVTDDGKVWPCCYYSGLFSQDVVTQDKHLEKDPKLKYLLYKHKDFNDLKKNKFKDIINHPIFAEYINESGWDSNVPPGICVWECQNKNNRLIVDKD